MNALRDSGGARPLWRRLAGRLPRSLKDSLLARYWALVEFNEHAIEYSLELAGHVPSHALRLMWYRQIGGVRIGRDSSIHRGCIIWKPRRIVIGDNTVVNYGVLLDGRGGLTIGDNVSISVGTSILTLGHDIDSRDFALREAPVIIEDYAFVGSFARILPGVTLSQGAVVGVGSVVTRDVPPFMIVAGSPARVVRERNRDLAYQLKHRKPFG